MSATNGIVESFGFEPARVSIQRMEQKAEQIARGGELVVDIRQAQSK
jgi:hypothetical protein